MSERLRIALLLAAVLLVNANTLRNSFTMDDGLYIVGNPQVTQPSLRLLFTPHKMSNLFRPFTTATYALNWALHGSRPFGYHLFNLLLHAAVTGLLYLLFLIILDPSPHARSVALAAAWLFAVHPIHAEAVASVAGRSELLAAGFLLAAWILHLRNRELLALFCFLLALLSKESAVAFLPLLLVGDYARSQLKPLLRYARITAVTLLYLGFFWVAKGHRFGQAGVAMLDNPLVNLPPLWRVLNAIRVAWMYAGLHLYPATLSCDYSFNQIPVYLDWRHTLPAALAALAALLAWLWTVRHHRPAWILAGGIYLAAFAATANILLPTGTIMAERLAYLPSAGFCLLLALCWNWLKERRRTLAWAVFVVLLAALAARTVVRNRDWQDNLTLYSAAVRAVPQSAKMHSALASMYMAGGQLDLARTELQSALRIYPDYPDALSSFGLLESWSGNLQAAGALMEKALNMSARDNPNYDFMAVNFAAVLLQTGHADAALDLLNREISESPSYARAWSNRAVLHYQRGANALARSDAQTALRLDPSNLQAHNLLRLLNPAPLPAPATQLPLP